MQQPFNEGGRRLPPRELPPETTTKQRPRQRTQEELEALRRERAEQPMLYDDFDTYYHAPRQGGRPRRKAAHNILWGIVLVLCLLLEASLGVLMAPQLLGIHIEGTPSYAFVGGSILEYDEAAYREFDDMRRQMDSNAIFYGVSIDGVDVGGMTRQQAREAVEAVLPAEGAQFDISIQIDGDEWLVGSQEIPMSRNVEDVVQRAYAIGRSNTTTVRHSGITPLQERMNAVQQLKTEPAALTTSVTFDHAALRSLTDIVAARYNRDPVNAAVTAFDFSTKRFSYSEDAAGKYLSADALYNQVVSHVDSGDYYAVVRMQSEEVLADVTKTELMNGLCRISTYTTSTTSNANRNTNVELSAQAINGIVVGPGEVFSFNQATGQRTAAKGYREATAISGGQTKPEVGGGVCQTSSTLFNAVARANLEIVTRSPHAWPSSYVKEGMDATVNWPGLDFQFRNNTDFPIYIVAWYRDRKVTVEIYGMGLENGATIDLESTCIRTIKAPTETKMVLNESLPKGTKETTVEARNGSVWETYQVWYVNGKEIKRELLCTSTYKAYQKTVEYNE